MGRLVLRGARWPGDVAVEGGRIAAVGSVPDQPGDEVVRVDGDIVTSSGVSAGTDMALALVARLHGRETAERAARVMEYIWNDDPDNDPFA